MDTSTLVETLDRAAENVPKDAKSRKQLHDAARKLIFAAEGQHELTHRILFSVRRSTASSPETNADRIAHSTESGKGSSRRWAVPCLDLSSRPTLHRGAACTHHRGGGDIGRHVLRKSQSMIRTDTA